MGSGDTTVRLSDPCLRQRSRMRRLVCRRDGGRLDRVPVVTEEIPGTTERCIVTSYVSLRGGALGERRLLQRWRIGRRELALSRVGVLRAGALDIPDDRPERIHVTSASSRTFQRVPASSSPSPPQLSFASAPELSSWLSSPSPWALPSSLAAARRSISWAFHWWSPRLCFLTGRPHLPQSTSAESPSCFGVLFTTT